MKCKTLGANIQANAVFQGVEVRVVTLVMYVLCMYVCACVSVVHALGFSLLCQVV